MPEQAVVNASPLILLSKARVIELLQQAAPSILVPEMVALEVNRRGELDPTARAVATTSWISTVATPGVPDAERLTTALAADPVRCINALSVLELWQMRLRLTELAQGRTDAAC